MQFRIEIEYMHLSQYLIICLKLFDVHAMFPIKANSIIGMIDLAFKNWEYRICIDRCSQLNILNRYDQCIKFGEIKH